MSKVLLIGFSLPSGSQGEAVQAYNLRAQQFVDALADDGHEIVYAARSQPHFKHTSKPEALTAYHEISFSNPGWHSKLKKLEEKTHPDCCVACDFISSYAASFMKWKIPVWMDIYGDPVAEKQAQMHFNDSDRKLFSIPTAESRILQKGDKFSTCSTPQKYALIGKLGQTGRLNRYTFGYHFAHAIPPSISSYRRPAQAEQGEYLIRSEQVDKNDFVLLWIGGYNVWMDEITLFYGLEKAMEKEPGLKFVSTGGPVVHENPYLKFRQLISRSNNKDRYVFLGWIPRNDVIRLYQEGDCGLSIDSDCYESELGTRTRLLEMLAYGLPVITSRTTEISEIIASEGFGRVFEIGNTEELAEVIIKMVEAKRSGKPENKEALTLRIHRMFSSQKMCEPLVRWCRNPAPSPDRDAIGPLQRLGGKARGKLRDWKVRRLGIEYSDPDWKV